MRRPLLPVVWMLGVAVAAGGCDGTSETPLTTVAGVVTVRGKPHREIEVRFQPEPGTPGGLQATGLTDAAGRYTLRTYDPVARAHRDGVPPGRYKVVLADNSREMPPDGKMPPSLVPAKFTDPRHTPLAFEVAAGEQTIDIVVP